LVEGGDNHPAIYSVHSEFQFSRIRLSEEIMTKITMMAMRNTNATIEAGSEAGTTAAAQPARLMLALACSLMLVSSAGAQVATLYNFGTRVADPAHANYPGFVAQGRDGNLFSTSHDGGTDNFHVASKTYLTAVVPNGATSGFIKVTTPGGVLESNQAFRVIP
jgi:hypothetical protein